MLPDDYEKPGLGKTGSIALSGLLCIKRFITVRGGLLFIKKYSLEVVLKNTD